MYNSAAVSGFAHVKRHLHKDIMTASIELEIPREHETYECVMVLHCEKGSHPS